MGGWPLQAVRSSRAAVVAGFKRGPIDSLDSTDVWGTMAPSRSYLAGEPS